MKLELKHLAPYLPYELKLKGNDGIYTLIGLRSPYKTNDKCFLTGEVRYENTTKIRSHVFNTSSKEEDILIPILRPLSGLTKEIEVNGYRFVPIEGIDQLFGDYNTSYEVSRNGTSIFEYKETSIYTFYNVNCFPWFIIQKLHEWHFDTNNLIKEGLAIDINTL